MAERIYHGYNFVLFKSLYGVNKKILHKNNDETSVTKQFKNTIKYKRKLNKAEFDKKQHRNIM